MGPTTHHMFLVLTAEHPLEEFVKKRTLTREEQLDNSYQGYAVIKMCRYSRKLIPARFGLRLELKFKLRLFLLLLENSNSREVVPKCMGPCSGNKTQTHKSQTMILNLTLFFSFILSQLQT